MSDVFIEYMVKRKRTASILLLKIGIVAATLLVSCFMIMISGLLGPFSAMSTLAVIGAVYGGYYLIMAQNVEFEYAVTNGEMDVDKITAQRRRRRVASINCREAESFGRYKAADHSGRDYQTRIFACDSPDSEGLWYFVARLKDKGSTLVVFNANEKMLNGIKPFLPRPIMHEAFKTGAE